MALLNDSVTVAILLIMIFGSLSFYFYTRLVQNEKRVALLENLLLTLKMTTEASFMGSDMFAGPDTVKAVSSPAPLTPDDVDTIDEEKYAELLKGIPSPPSDTEVKPKMDVNYESMTLKELQALGRQSGVAVHGLKKKEIIESLRKKPEMEGVDQGVQGFLVNLAEVPEPEAEASE